MEEQKKKYWGAWLTFKQSLALTLFCFICIAFYAYYNESRLSPHTTTITEVERWRGKGLNRIYYHTNDSVSYRNLLRAASLTGRIELKRLGLPKRAKNLNIKVSYYGFNEFGQTYVDESPVGMRLGKNNYVKDAWYYWTLYSTISKESVAFFVLFIACWIGFYCRRNGVTGKIVTIYRCFCAVYIVFLLFVL